MNRITILAGIIAATAVPALASAGPTTSTFTTSHEAMWQPTTRGEHRRPPKAKSHKRNARRQRRRGRR